MLWNRSFEIRSCIEILANDINVDTTYQHMLCTNNKGKLYTGTYWGIFIL